MRQRSFFEYKLKYSQHKWLLQGLFSGNPRLLQSINIHISFMSGKLGGMALSFGMLAFWIIPEETFNDRRT